VKRPSTIATHEIAKGGRSATDPNPRIDKTDKAYQVKNRSKTDPSSATNRDRPKRARLGDGAYAVPQLDDPDWPTRSGVMVSPKKRSRESEAKRPAQESAVASEAGVIHAIEEHEANPKRRRNMLKSSPLTSLGSAESEKKSGSPSFSPLPASEEEEVAELIELLPDEPTDVAAEPVAAEEVDLVCLSLARAQSTGQS
jgi:hypothetical protein